jgi:BirA family transcriptional regulator, biotin operon repressor / biotin---[acetyl-CoA-carboxylase] ligase
VLALAKEDWAEGLWLRALRQTAGRGRMGRQWVSPPGNLYTSTLIRLRRGDPDAATLGFVAAVALYQVLSSYMERAALLIKWPNDVMAHGAKLSGILLERTGDAVVVGIGVNLASNPEVEGRQTISLAALIGHAPDPAVCLDMLADAFASCVTVWRTEGLARIIALWEAYAHPLGASLMVTLPDGTRLDGHYQGLDASGALRLCLADGAIRVIHAGDVFLI